jgi:transcriptional regulator with XRE-family HTH domain
MGLISKKDLLARLRRGREARAKLLANNVAESIASQIVATRDKRGWTQSKLAAKAGMGQNNLSRLENPDYGKHTVSSLKRLADALDVALVVRFVPFSRYIYWLSGTPHIDEGISPAALAVPSFEDEERLGQLESESKIWMLYVTPKVEVADDTVTTTEAPPQPDIYVLDGYEPESQVAS